MTTAELLDRVRATRGDWDAAIAGLTDAQLAAPVLPGGWCVRDVMAHIAWFEREMIGWVCARRFVGSDLWMLPCDDRNAAIHAANRDRTLDDVRDEADRTWSELLAALATLSDADLSDPAAFPGMPLDWTPLLVLAGNTFEHYPPHAARVRERFGRG